MSEAIPLIPRVKLDAEGNLAKFIDHARNDLTSFGANLNFDTDWWDVTDYYSKKGHRNSKQGTITIHFSQRLKEGGAPFCDQVKGFAKAYIRSNLGNRASASFTFAITAFRALNEAIQQLDVQSLVDCDASVFNKAAEFIRAKTDVGDNESAGYMLAKIARYLDEKGMVYAPLHNWHYPRIRKATGGRVGPEFEQRRQQKMPDPAALDGLAQAFHLAAEPRDVLITSVAAILCSAPERINEVMVLPENCEVEQDGKDGRKYLGLRWAGSKGAADHIKWILPGMTDVVREALARIRRITEPAREMARWYEQNPEKLFLPPELEHLRDQDIMVLDKVWQIVNLAPNKRAVRSWMQKAGIPFIYIPFQHPIQGEIQIKAARFADIERHIVNTLPPGFPIYDEGRDLKYSEALLVIPGGLFGNRSDGDGSRCMFEVVKYHHIGCALGQNKLSGSTTVFQRVGIDAEGKLGMRSHQFRHWLNTLAQGANLSQVDIAKWSGRASVHQNVAYDHVSSEEIVTKLREAVGDHAKAIGPLAEIPKNLPVSRVEFATMAVPTAHVTLYGFCIHDFTSTPCEMFRKCLDCREHVCIKGIPDKTQRVRQALEETKQMLVRAQQAVVEEVYGAEDWVATNQAAVNRMEQLLAILTDPTVADGAVVQLSATNTYSLSEGALLDRMHLEGSGTPTLPGAAPRKALR
ncbi:integrase [Noviherbaspirillum galbum]|uniref:Integrase n=1 Tax=Noviherbaspirillum galbum TaxID=2709383 RepID=A0A6B3SNQ8_9BURK|nr:integrase [Noviherbaspirillum galbum]NEX60092.1 integrase [Noviherbaspirillum galbum]